MRYTRRIIPPFSALLCNPCSIFDNHSCLLPPDIKISAPFRMRRLEKRTYFVTTTSVRITLPFALKRTLVQTLSLNSVTLLA